MNLIILFRKSHNIFHSFWADFYILYPVSLSSCAIYVCPIRRKFCLHLTAAAPYTKIIGYK